MQLTPARRTLLNQVGIVILVAGFCLGGLIYRSAPPEAAETSADLQYDDSPLSLEDTRRYRRDAQLNFGQLGLLADKGTRLAAKLGEPKPLAITITLVSVLGAAGCFAVGAQRNPMGEE